MRKTVSITISGQLFHIEEQAYRTLDEYLESIRYHFSTYEDREEIVSDIEGRIAEHFNEKLSKARNVVSEADVNDLIAHMGTVKDFEAFEAEAPHDAPKGKEHRAFEPPRRLYRDADNQMIAGVASGIANYFGIDPTVVRLLFVATLFFGGAGIILYIVLWIILPEARTTSEKVEMRGQPLTLRRIEATIRENIPAAQERIKPGTLTRIVQFPFTLLRQFLNFLGRMLRAALPIAGRIIGFIIAAWAVAGLFVLTFAAIMLAAGAWDAYLDVPVRQLAGDLTYYMLLLSGYVAVFVPALLALIFGSSLLLLRNVFRLPLVISLLALWVLSLMLGAVTIGKEGPVIAQKVDQYVQTHNTAATRELPLPAFSDMRVRDGYDVRVLTGAEPGIRVTGSRAAVESLRIDVDETGTLDVRRERRHHFCIICLGNDALIEITMTGSSIGSIESYAGASVLLEGITIDGEKLIVNGGSRLDVRGGGLPETLTAELHAGSRLNLESADTVELLTLDVSGGSSASYAAGARNADLDIVAGSFTELRGTGSALKASVVAGSNLEAYEFAVQRAGIEAQAGGRATVHATESLTGYVTSGGELLYTGEPDVNVTTDPSGHVGPGTNEFDLNEEQ